MTGFLGTRADVFMDLAITFFVAAPFLMTYALRLAVRGRYKAHRNLQAGLVVGGTVAVLLLEGSHPVRGGDGGLRSERLLRHAAGQRAVLRTSLGRYTMVHRLVRPDERFLAPLLPRAAGALQFDTPLCGVVTYAGFWFTCITGVAMYVLCYAL